MIVDARVIDHADVREGVPILLTQEAGVVTLHLDFLKIQIEERSLSAALVVEGPVP